MSAPEHTNRLIHETSPYLLQHAHNPVDWYPWGEEALQLAKKEDTPILLSIGYSACHWCHVMERECFENREIAALMNKHFVCIKVDREERPDLDTIYMTAVQMMTGRGGWPMTVFLTPDQVPFYAGTYFPPEDRYGMPGFRRVLLSVAQAYRERREAFYSNIQMIAADLREATSMAWAPGRLDTTILDAAAEGLTRNFDATHGGFGSAPKFPPSMALAFLLRAYLRTGRQRFLEIVEHTLRRMAAGGIYDHLGGGFHRYSVDAEWRVPHFEKMLYDNALLSRIYLEAYLLTGTDHYRRIATETLDYVVREMTSPEGGFYSSQDADSEGREGAFFLWTLEEIKSVLGEEEGAIVGRYFGCTAAGNFEGKNILHAPLPLADFARQNAFPEDRLREVLRRAKSLLWQARERRVKPGRDTKVLTAWNALMMRSFAEAADALGREDYRAVAVRNAEFLLYRLRRDGGLLRSYRDGQAKLNGYLEDYALLIDALVAVYEATFEADWVRSAEALAGVMVEKFWDSENGGFYLTSSDHEVLINRPKEFYDNAMPSGNSAAASALLRLWKLTGEEKWMQHAVRVLEMMAEPMTEHPAALPYMLCALDFHLSPPREIAIIGSPAEEKTPKFLEVLHRRFYPNKVVACGLAGEPHILKDKKRVDDQVTAYVCEGFTCGSPITEPGDLALRLEGGNTQPV